jgi:hypothetical protein
MDRCGRTSVLVDGAVPASISDCHNDLITCSTSKRIGFNPEHVILTNRLTEVLKSAGILPQSKYTATSTSAVQYRLSSENGMRE